MAPKRGLPSWTKTWGIFPGKRPQRVFGDWRGQDGRISPANKIMEKNRQATGLVARLLLVALSIIAGVILFEFLKNLFLPDLSLWNSHIITIIFVSVIGTLAAYFFLNKYYKLLNQIDQNLLERQQSEQALKDGYIYLTELLNEQTVNLARANEALRSEFIEHQQDAMALRFHEAQSRVLADQADSIILRLNLKGQVTFFNKFAQALFGFSEDEIRGYSVIGTIVPETDTAGRNLAVMIADLISHPERYTINENENM